MQTRVFSLVALPAVALVGLSMSACGSDDPPEDCVGHGCSADWNPLVREGGEARFDVVELADGSWLVRPNGFLLDSATSRQFPATPGCTKMIEGGEYIRFPLQSPAASDFVNGGATMTWKSENTEIVLDAVTDGVAPALGIVGTPMYIDERCPGVNCPYAIGDIERGVYYDVTIPGGPGYDAMTIEDKLYMPEHFEWESDPFDDELEITGGEDFTLTWIGSDQANAGYALMGFIDDGGLQYLCVDDSPDGSMTVPQSIVDSIPATGSILHGVFSHSMVNVDDPDPEGRRFDLLGLSCKLTSYAVQ